MEIHDIRQYRSLVDRVAERSSLLLGASEKARCSFWSWVRSLEESFGVSIHVETIMGPDNRPSAVGGVISGRDRSSRCRMAFTVNAEETRFALQYVP
ncbi:MAG: hypothetical protein KC468_17570 [Myxococcales bacterium]|nr:hypothetical protein [Myxococcales bacterium]